MEREDMPIYHVSIALAIKAESKDKAIECFWDTVDNRRDAEGRVLITPKVS